MKTTQATPEIIRYKIPPAQAADFVQAYRQAESLLQASPHCNGYELIQSRKEPENFLLTIWWDSPEGHLQGFRSSELFPKFLQLVRPFVPMIQEMEHYHSAGLNWRRAE